MPNITDMTCSVAAIVIVGYIAALAINAMRQKKPLSSVIDPSEKCVTESSCSSHRAIKEQKMGEVTRRLDSDRAKIRGLSESHGKIGEHIAGLSADSKHSREILNELKADVKAAIAGQNEIRGELRRMNGTAS